MRTFLLLLFSIFCLNHLLAQHKHHVSILGTYHFSNPGNDEYNMQVENYLSEKRQAEIDKLLKKIERYKPTMIFVESSASRFVELNKKYESFKNSEKEELPVNEVYQLGFKLAERLDHEVIYPVDAAGWWLMELVDAYFDEYPSKLNDQFDSEMSKEIVAREERFAKNTVLENHIEMNSEEAIMQNHYYYVAVATKAITKPMEGGYPLDMDSSKLIFGVPHIYLGLNQENPGPELVGEWYKRNIRIFSNILFHVDQEKEDQRILIIFGNGHTRILQHLFEDHPNYKFEMINDYLQN